MMIRMSLYTCWNFINRFRVYFFRRVVFRNSNMYALSSFYCLCFFSEFNYFHILFRFCDFGFAISIPRFQFCDFGSDFDFVELAAFPSGQSYFIKLFDAGLLREFIRSFLSRCFRGNKRLAQFFLHCLENN